MNHSELINIAKALGYHSITDEGLCRGFAMMWSQAVCLKDLDSFKERMHLLDRYKTDPKSLVSDLSTIRSKIKKNVAYVPTSLEQRILEIPAFFEGVALYLTPEKHAEVFSQGDVRQINVEIISNYTKPVNEGLAVPLSRLDQYTPKDLAIYLTSLTKTLEQSDHFAIVFAGNNHAVSARYLGSGKFEYIDTNSRTSGDMAHWVGNASGLAEQIFLSLGKQKAQLLLRTEIIVPSSDLPIHNTNMPPRNKVNKLYSDERGNTILHFAALLNDLTFFEQINGQHINVNQVNNEGDSALMMAASNPNPGVFNYLVSLPSIDLSHVNSRGFSVLDSLAQAGNIDSLRQLLQDPRMKIPSNPPYLLRNLVVCSRKNKDVIPLVEELLAQKKISVNPGKDKWSPLHIACATNNMEMATLLLRYGASIDAKSEEGETPLHRAAADNNTEILELLLKNNADCNPKNNAGLTSFDMALKNDNFAVAQKLLAHTKFDAENFGKHWSLKSLKCPIDIKVQILKKALQDYIQMRQDEPEFKSLFKSGFSREKKIEAAKALMFQLENPAQKLSAEQISVLQNGRLKNLFTNSQEIHLYRESMHRVKQFKESFQEMHKAQAVVDNPSVTASPMPGKH